MDGKAYRQLTVWQRAMDMVDAVYILTRRLPDEERFGLISQLRRAVVSVPANIAEGYGRLHLGDYVRHLSIARGSLMELETHLIICVRLAMLVRDDVAAVWQIVQEVGRMLTKLIESLKSRPQTPDPRP